MIMTKSLLLLFVMGLTSVFRSDAQESMARILQVTQRADHLFHLPETTPKMDSEALAGYTYVAKALESYPVSRNRDSLLTQTWLKKGILLDIKLDYAGAKQAYCRSLQIASAKDDSLIFLASILAGTSYYNLNVFDSSNYYLLRAELMAERYPNTGDAVRLYNSLGVLYHDNGNYLQGKNYFNKALQIVQGKKPFDTASAVNIQTNMAACYYRLGDYRKALDMYHQILGYHLFTQQIYLNMGMAYASLEEYPQALQSFKKVGVKDIPGVLNEMADVYLHLKRTDSAASILDRLPALARNSPVSEADLGINDLLRGDLLSERRQYLEALAALQQATIRFARDFNNTDIYSNPTEFTGTYACYRLFDALNKKAAVFEALYRSQPKDQYLQAALATYRSTLSLLRYIEKSYDTDDAKIFLKRQNTGLYRKALSICLELYRLHPEKDYLSEAFLISERSKASIITSNLKERVFNKVAGVSEELWNKERNIKYHIARLNARSESETDSHEVKNIARDRAAYEIDLSRVQKDLERNDNFYRLKYDDSSPGIAAFQSALGDEQALFSFAATDSALHLFALTRHSFTYLRIDSLSDLQQGVESWLRELKTAESGRRFRGDSVGGRLYTRLIGPMQALARGKDEWIVVPDGFLYFLPFESLPSDGAGHSLLETTTISYQFSGRLMLSDVSAAGARGGSAHPGQVLAFAPFASAGGQFGGGMGFGRLPASWEEVEGLPGRQYIDSEATKQHFQDALNQYPILHLATHAVSSVNNAAASFIAFYPVHRSVIEDCLFLEELYGLNMGATRLVVLSACESGQGELVSNEGVISLARAFAYAGCESSVNSLWKADDQATSFILKKFHVYLEQGWTKSKALRQAKLDYLHSDALNKSPAYWAHLILTGNTEPIYPSSGVRMWMTVGGILVLLAIAAVVWMLWRWRKRKKKKPAL